MTELAETLDIEGPLTWGILRRLGREKGWIAVDRSRRSLRFSLAVPATEVDLGEVAIVIGRRIRPSLPDWRDTSADPALEAATIAVEKGRNAWGRRGVGTLAELVKVLDANRGGKRKARR